MRLSCHCRHPSNMPSSAYIHHRHHTIIIIHHHHINNALCFERARDTQLHCALSRKSRVSHAIQKKNTYIFLKCKHSSCRFVTIYQLFTINKKVLGYNMLCLCIYVRVYSSCLYLYEYQARISGWKKEVLLESLKCNQTTTVEVKI